MSLVVAATLNGEVAAGAALPAGGCSPVLRRRPPPIPTPPGVRTPRWIPQRGYHPWVRGIMVGMTQVPGLDEVAEELYAAMPAGFVARRDELSRRARASGGRALAAAIKSLRRPTVGAWYLNVGSRAGLPSLQDWLRLGDDLRQAQASGDVAALRSLAAQRAPLETRVLSDVTALLAKRGVAATASGLEEVRATLGAALADPDVEALVAAGRVDRPLAYAGFGPLDPTVLLTARTEDGTPGDSAAERTTDEHEQTGLELVAAEQELAALSARKHVVEADLRERQARVQALEAALAQARAAQTETAEALTAVTAEEKVLTARLAHLRDLRRR